MSSLGLGFSTAVPPTTLATASFDQTSISKLYIRDNNLLGTYNTWKRPVNVATTGVITLSGSQIIDGVLVIENSYRVLVKDQTNATENGIYVVRTGVWDRADDFIIGSQCSGSMIYVSSGTVGAEKVFICNSPLGSDYVGTNNIVFSEFGGNPVNYEVVTVPGSTLDLDKVSILSPTPPVFSGFLNIETQFATCVATDSEGNVFISTSLTTTTLEKTIVKNRDGTASNLLFPVVLDNSTAIVKYDKNGIALAYAIIESDDNSSFVSMMIDSNDNLYVAGRSTIIGTANVFNFTTDNNPVSHFGYTSIDGCYYLIKFSKYGAALGWTSILPDIQTNGDGNNRLAIDTDDNVYMAGGYRSAGTVTVTDFSPDNSTGASAFVMPLSATDVSFIVKWSSSGVSTSWTYLNNNNVFIYNIKTDSQNNLYAVVQNTGSTTTAIYNFSTTSSLGSTSFSTRIPPPPYDYNIVKWAANGTANSWTVTIGYGTVSVAFDSEDNLFMSSTNGYTSAYPIYNFTSTNTLTTTPFSIPAGSDGATIWSTGVIKWNSTGTADSWTQMQNDFPGGYRSIVIDSKDNLYLFDGAFYLANPTPKPIRNFSTTSSPGTTVFNATEGGMIGVKWDSLGIVTLWTQTSQAAYSYPFYAVVDIYDNVYIGLNIVPNPNQVVFSDLTDTTPNGRVTSINGVSHVIKYLNTGILDLGHYDPDITFTIPDGTIGTVSTKQVILKTTNYNYGFDLGSYSVQVDGVFGNLGMNLIFLWTGSAWILVPS
jgi:hypothetical protein